MQVPENTNLKSPSFNPYSPRHSNYYISEIIKNYKDPKSNAREHLTTSLQILKAMENSKMPSKQ